MTALLVAMLQMVGGVSTVLPQNVAEFAWFFVTILAGTVLFAAVQGVICGIVTVGDPDEIAWRQNYDALNFMMADQNVPHEEKLSVRSFFRKSRRLFKRQSYVALIDTCLSPELKQDIRFLISESLFDSVWYLKECDREFLEDLASFIVRTAYAPHEDIDTDNKLNVLTAGMATRGTTMINAGTAFGDIILTARALRDTTPARTMIYCEAARITRDNLLEALKEHPEAQAVIHQASIKLAINRAMVVISLHVHMRRVTSDQGTAKRASSAARSEAAKQSAQSAWEVPQEKEIAADLELKETLHPLLGMGAWKEIEYGQDGRAKAVVSESVTGHGPEADAMLDQVNAAAPSEQIALLAKFVITTNSRLDSLTDAITAVVSSQAKLELAASKASVPSWMRPYPEAPAEIEKSGKGRTKGRPDPPKSAPSPSHDQDASSFDA